MSTTIRKILAATFMGCVSLTTIAFGACAPRMAHAAEIVNVEYIVGFVKNKWDVDVPYVKEEIHWAANVEYLLKVVDYVNGKLNNGEKTNYGESEYATKEVVDTIAANQAIRTLIKKKDTNCPANTFCFTPAESNGNNVSFVIGAKGTFYVDWDDGTTKTIEKTELGIQEISHEYADAAANHTIKLSGRATEYAPPININQDGYIDSSVALVFVDVNKGTIMELSSIDGCLGCVFPTLANGAQPVFYGAFVYQEQLKTLPSTLFNGITGAGYPFMFYQTFTGCSGLESIPDKLFGELSGAPAEHMFANTFSYCTGLKSIPENLFAGIQGAPAEAMFAGTFGACTGLTSIPENLFAGIKGAPARSMFGETFGDCVELKSIPENLFAGIKGAPARAMFSYTFSGCSGLKSIPKNLFAGISGAPAMDMFSYTFDRCSGLKSIPENLFAGIQGAPAEDMFERTFNKCSELTSIPEHLFDGIDTGGSYQTAMFGYTFFDCTSLTGPSARINGRYLYEIWPEVLYWNTYYNATGLSDYDCIPTNWGGGGTKNPGECPIPETE